MILCFVTLWALCVADLIVRWVFLCLKLLVGKCCSRVVYLFRLCWFCLVCCLLCSVGVSFDWMLCMMVDTLIYDLFNSSWLFGSFVDVIYY